MGPVSEEDSIGFPDDTDENTVELEPLSEQALRAAEQAQGPADLGESEPEASAATPALAAATARADGASRLGRWPLAFLVALPGAAAAVALWGAAQRATERHSAVPSVTIRVPVPTAPVAEPPVDPQLSPVRVRNPFDASEVFEFPPGTSPGEARQSVAEQLLERARERGAGAGVKLPGGSPVTPERPDESAGLAQSSAPHGSN